MKKMINKGIIGLLLASLLTGCGQNGDRSPKEENQVQDVLVQDMVNNKDDSWIADAVNIVLSDDGITVDGNTVEADNTSAAVYTAHDIVYYEEGKDFKYGEGTEADEHSKEEADAHTVVHITQPGTYAVSGSMSAGQIAIDLGEDAEENPEAVVVLVLNGVDIKCSVAPAVIFYNVYESCSAEAEGATKDVNTAKAGANVIIADGTVNNVTGSYVARIYKSIELSADGTEVVDSKKLHKYDGAFYSKMSMNVDGGSEGTGVLNIVAENEGLDSELHLTLNGGNVNITSGNDGINTNEDGVSVTTINGGMLNILVDGTTGEGDGIDSNGWLVINGGTVIAQACAISGDAGIDSDMGIHINGGTVIATGNMLDHISDSQQNYAVFNFASIQNEGATYVLKNTKEEVIAQCAPENAFTYLIVSGANLTEGTYTLWKNDMQLAGAAGEGGRGGMFGGQMPGGMQIPEGGQMPGGMQIPEGGQMPEGMQIPEGGQMPGGMQIPEGGQMPGGMQIPEGGQIPEGMQRPDDGRGKGGNFGNRSDFELSSEFAIEAGGNYFMWISEQS